MTFSGPGIKLFLIYGPDGQWTDDYEQVTTFSWVKTPVSIHGPGVRVLKRLGHIMLMANPQVPIFAKQNIRTAPWAFLGAMILGLATCYFGFAPRSYLFACSGLAVVWFALLVFSWRRRSDELRILSLLFVASSGMFWEFFIEQIEG